MTNTSIRNKGEYLTDFPSDYTVIDIETTGLSSTFNEIIELSALKVRKDKVVDKFSQLVKPSGRISSFISRLTGISNELVKDAGSIENILPAYLEFIADDIVLGHNVNFDINFIYDNLKKFHNKEFNNNYIDTMKISRKYLALASNSLSSLAKHYKVDTTGHHRALNDCMITLNIYKKFKKENACLIKEQTLS